MFTAAAENLLRQARAVQEEELRRFASRVAALLQVPEPGPEAVDCLQRLHLTLAATKYPRKLDGKFVELLQTVLCSSKCSEQIQVLCAAILREMSPCNDLILSCDEIEDTKLLSLVSSILLVQGNKKAEVSAVGQRVVKVLERKLPEGQSARYLLPVLSNVISLAPESLTEEQTNVVSKKMTDWLRYASIQQGVAQPSGGFFSSPRSRQPGRVTEMDGAVATDFFTVLSVGQYYTQDQWLNMQAFSMLRSWLLCYGGTASKPPSSDDKSGMDRSVMSVASTTSTSSRLLPPKERLREKAFEYCQRLIEQSNRRPLKKDDGDLQKACLIEAVTIMDIICKQDSSYVYRAASFLKILHSRICGDATYARTLLPIAQFFLNHSKVAAVDSDAIYKHLFTDIPAQLFHNPSLAFEFIQFCKDNSQLFTETSSIFRQSFPNLFKFLAWNSPPLISEFVDLLPFLLDAGTAIEIFHLLLDLPCLTAALDIQLRVLSSQLVMLCRLRPALVVELSTEILEFAGTISNIQNKEAIFTHLVWAIGEYLSVAYDKRCTVEQVTRFFETLEAMLFEMTQLRPLGSTPSYAPRAISVLMATLTKLATRSQDLIPRVSMFLSKMRTFVQSPAVTSVYREEDLEQLLIRATELMNLLKMPSVAQFVFTSPTDVARTRFQREVNDSLPFALRIVTRLLEPTPGFMPG
ncbi:AP-5 complex subunit zeta-1 isoform X2 [Colius striatus]|uniref:AP-5 complex subunit zeta-1 isoform X2 n=1 Tax=Colius striatus TaxID=57412 RepID=UPI002B1D2DA8|nr:AP-5 complex subunit zeta-1 isoform X2 [Colius striatus]